MLPTLFTHSAMLDTRLPVYITDHVGQIYLFSANLLNFFFLGGGGGGNFYIYIFTHSIRE